MNRNAHPGTATDPQELRAQVEDLRAELGETVQALAAKADVRSRAQAKAARARMRVYDRTARMRGRARDTAAHVRHPHGEAGAKPPRSKRVRSKDGNVASLARTARDHRMAAAGLAAALTGVAVACRRRSRQRRR